MFSLVNVKEDIKSFTEAREKFFLSMPLAWTCQADERPIGNIRSPATLFI